MPTDRWRYRIDMDTGDALSKALLASLPDTALLLDAQACVRALRPGNVPLPGAGPGATPEAFLPMDSAEQLRELLRAARAAHGSQILHFEQYIGDRTLLIEARAMPQPDDATLLLLRDITHSHREELLLRQRVYRDALTGLANRELFERELQRAIRTSERTGRQIAVLFVDLDRFKRINDTLGHAVGDRLLQAVARRLEHCLRPTDVVARPDHPAPPQSSSTSTVSVSRLCGDEFVILATELTGRDQAERIAGRVRQSVSEPFNCEGQQFVVTPSIGIAVYPFDARTVSGLLARADRAMYAAKSQGRNAHVFYCKAFGTHAAPREARQRRQ